MRPRSLAPILIALGLLAGCAEQPTEPGTSPPAFAILDGAHGGNPAFYFLPPMVRAPSYSGTFDATQSPVVTICELAGTTCGTTVASFSGSAVKLDLTAEAYVAIWKTRDAGLDPTKTYRIQVLVGANLLGYADVVVLLNGSQIRTVDKNQFVSVINGGVLQIRFRIEAEAPPPPPGPWQEGDLVTYSQDSWGSDPATSAAAALLVARFGLVYPFSAVEVGVSGTAGFSMVFTSASAVLAYLPALGGPAPLNSDLLDPTSTSAGVLGGFVLALRLDVDFSDASYLVGNSGLRFGDLRLCRFTSLPALNGNTVREFLGLANQMLGGATPPSGGPYTIDDLALVTRDLTLAFEGGVVSQFAQDHLVNGACSGGWQNGDLVTYGQGDWSDATTTAGVLLNNSFNALYGALGYVEAGIPGAAGFSMRFTSAAAVFTYMPASGAPAALDADLLDPASTAAGIFGGEVLALRFNIDLSDADFLSGTTSIDIGNLTLCGLAQSGLNGMTVRAFQDVANTALGGGSTAYAIADLSAIAGNINSAFSNGAVSLFAQANLFNGPCP